MAGPPWRWRLRAARPGGYTGAARCSRTDVRWTASVDLVEGSTMDRGPVHWEGPIFGWPPPKSSPIGTNVRLDGTKYQSNRTKDTKEGEGYEGSGQIFLQQIGIDRERRLGALGGGDDDPLHRPGRIAGDIQSREVRRLVLAGADRALLV